jgi:hypothetical protein
MVHIEERESVEIIYPHGEGYIIKEAAEYIMPLRNKPLCLLLLHGDLPPFYSVPGLKSFPICPADVIAGLPVSIVMCGKDDGVDILDVRRDP